MLTEREGVKVFDSNIGFSLKNSANNRFVACSDNGNIYTDAFNYGQGRHEWRIHVIEEARYFCFENIFSSKILIIENDKICSHSNSNYKKNLAGHWVLHPVESTLDAFYLINRVNKEYLVCSDDYNLIVDTTRMEKQTYYWMLEPSRRLLASNTSSEFSKN